MQINITDIDHLGNGLGKIDNKIVFVPKSVKGDICDIEIYKSYKNYDIAKINKIIKKSDLRIDAICPYYYECGGCNISNISYQNQLLFKENKIKNIFKKYLNIDISPKIIPSQKEYSYRNKITYHMSSALGLIKEYGSILPINKCLLVSDKINTLYNEIKKEDLSKVKKITIKECDNGLLLSITGNMKIDAIKSKCISIYINNKEVYKKEDGYILLNNIKYLISDKSFFQINTTNITSLYNEIIKYGEFTKEDKVIDLYCGVGSISLYISKYVKSVLGIELVPDAIKDAKTNAKINNINNTKFICGDVSKLIDKNIDGDIIIADPPRVGLDNHTIEVINNKKIKKLIYVSCDPMTLVRDIKKLTNYNLTSISIIDMFPQTHHVETIVLLKLK